MSEQKINQILELTVSISSSQEQVIQRLDSIDKRLSVIEIKMGQVAKWISLENADIIPERHK